MVEKQAKYLRQLTAQYPKSAAVAKPEQVEQMKKDGVLAW